MKTIEEIQELLQEGKIEEGYKELVEYQNKNKDDLSLYFLTLIDIKYHFENIDLEITCEKFDKLIKSKNINIRRNSFVPYISLLLEVDYIEKCYYVSKQAIDEGLDDYLINYGYARGLMEFKENYSSEVEQLLLDVIKNISNENVRVDSEIKLCELYCKNKKFKEAEEFINKTYFIEGNDLTTLLNLILATYKNPDNENKHEYEQAMNSQYKYGSLVFLSDYYYDKKNYERALSYLDELIVITSNDINIQKRKVLCLKYLDKDEEALDLLKTMNQDDPDVNYQIGSFLINKVNIKFLHESKKYLLKALEESINYPIISSLYRVCERTLDLDTFKIVIDKFEEVIPKHPLLSLGKIKYYNHSLDFDRAEKIAKQVGKLKYDEEFIFETSYCEKNPKKTYKNIVKLISQDELDFFKIRSDYYGEFGLKINKINCDKFIKENIETQSNCVDSLITRIYLDRNDIDNALKYVNKGLNQYYNNVDNCTCIVGYYAYMLMNGIGIEKNIEKAYDIAKETIIDNFGAVSESLGNIYAECAIYLNKDLNEVYDFLIKTIEKRYTLSRYFMIIKVGKLLNKDVSYYEKMYKKSFKYCTILEKQYYETNPSTFMMNNF